MGQFHSPIQIKVTILQVSSYNDFMGFYSDLMGFYSDFSIQGLVNVLSKHHPPIVDISSPTNT